MQPVPTHSSDLAPDVLELCSVFAAVCPVPTAAVTGIEHEIRYVNAAFCVLTERSRDELVGRPFREIVPENKECLALMSRVSRTGRAEAVPGEESSTAASLMWSYNMWPAVAEDGGIAGVLIQVTETRHAHERIAAVNQALLISSLQQHELTEQARALNIRLAADAILLQRSADSLQRANQDLERFTSVASHDLQEPLRTVTAYTQLLARQMGPRLQPDDQVLMQFIVDGSLRMSALIKDLLAFARIGDEGQSRQSVDCSFALQEALANLKGSIDEAQGVITSDSLPSVTANFPQVVRLFQNLVGNALKYRKAGTSPAIHVTSVREAAGWTISVSDNGIGFDPIYGQQIFGVFKRLHGKQYPGTGIGLATCQRIVALHGGSIWATGVEDVGATFSFMLPDTPQAIGT